MAFHKKGHEPAGDSTAGEVGASMGMDRMFGGKRKGKRGGKRHSKRRSGKRG